MAARTGADLEYLLQPVLIHGFVSLDGASNVIGFQPTNAPLNLAGPGNNLPYTRCRGIQNSLGPAGAIITQPHTGTGIYQFTLDEAWFGALEGWVQLTDQGAVAAVNYFIDVNATGSTGSTSLGYFPGQNQSLPAQTIKVTFRATGAGALTNPVANTGFWMSLTVVRGLAQ
jgi:hypothetical protein